MKFLQTVTAFQALLLSVPSLATSDPFYKSPRDAADPLLQCLHAGLSTAAAVETVGQPTFYNDTARYSMIYAPTYRAVVKVAGEEDVATAIKCASQTNTSFLATSARHGFSQTLASIRNGLEIDTSYFDHVDLDVDASTVTTGGAVIFQRVIDTAYHAGKEIPTGSTYCVGMLGATLGAGVGRLQGVHGLMIDSLLSVRMMLPNTTVVEASEQSNPELFWGARSPAHVQHYPLRAQSVAGSKLASRLRYVRVGQSADRQ